MAINTPLSPDKRFTLGNYLYNRIKKFRQRDNVQLQNSWNRNLDKGTILEICGLLLFTAPLFLAFISILLRRKKEREERKERKKKDSNITLILSYLYKFRQRDNVIPPLGQCPNFSKPKISS